MVHRRVLDVHQAEAGHLLADFFGGKNADAEHRLAFHLLGKGKLGAWKQANGHIRLADRSESLGDRVLNFVTSSLSSIWAGRVATLWRL